MFDELQSLVITSKDNTDLDSVFQHYQKIKSFVRSCGVTPENEEILWMRIILLFDANKSASTKLGVLRNIDQLLETGKE